MLLGSGTGDGILDESFTYDGAGRLASVTVTKLDGTTLTTPQVTWYTYDLAGNMKTTTTSTGSATLTASYSYDDQNRLTLLTNTGSSSTLSNFSYAYDDAGHMTHVVEIGVDGTGVTRTIDYGYDADYRLTSEPDTVGSSPTCPFDQPHL